MTTLTDFLERIEQAEQRFRSPEMSVQQWGDVIAWLEQSHQRFFDEERSPDGDPWQELSDWTIKKKGHSRKLIETYALMQSMTTSGAEYAIRTVEPTSLEFGTERPWAESHQYGTDRIPQREFAGIPADGLVEVVDIVADAAVEMLLRELEGL